VENECRDVVCDPLKTLAGVPDAELALFKTASFHLDAGQDERQASSLSQARLG
jgi:hypothetical protein